MSDDDKTPPYKRAKSQWDDEKRANVGKEHRRTPPRGFPAVTREQLDELEQAAPQEFQSEDNTQPTHPLDPVTAELWERHNRLKAEVRRGRRESTDQLLEAMGKRPPNERITAIETRLKIMIAILAAVATIAGGALFTVAKGLYERGEADGALHIRMDNVERGVAELQRELGMPDRYLRQVFPFPTSKGSTP